MMFGSREAFTYRECRACGSLWLQDVPDDLGPHYPPAYYGGDIERHQPPGSAITRALVRTRVAPEVFTGRGSLSYRAAGVARHLVAEPEVLAAFRPLIRRYGIGSFSDRILDVGCGWTPARLCALRCLGFRHLRGIDPYVPAALVHHGIPVYRQDVAHVDGTFDVIMFHHSLEHVRDPLADLAAAMRVLRPGGRILVRTPIAGSALWERYRADWWELDAPRHLVLFSMAGLEAAAARLGLRVAATFFDSSERELIGSEQIRRDLGQFEPGSWFLDPSSSPFSAEDVASFHEEALRLNASGRAGRGGFVLRVVRS